TTGAGNMADSRYTGGKLMMAIAGDDAQAKKAVLALATDLGFEATDVGPLAMSRQLEPLALLWIKLAYAQKLGRDFGFSLMRRCAGGAALGPRPRCLASILPHCRRRDGRAGAALDLQRLHHERKLLHVLGDQLFELEILQEMHAVHHQGDLVDR